jgi:GAF domain-containing protein
MDEVLEQLRSVVAAIGNRGWIAGRAAQVIRDGRGYRWVGLYDVDATEIVALGWSGDAEPAFPRFSVHQGLNGAAVRSARAVVVQDVGADARYLPTFESTAAEAIFPVVSNGEVVGTIDAESDQLNAFTREDEVFLAECARILLPLWVGPRR